MSETREQLYQRGDVVMAEGSTMWVTSVVRGKVGKEKPVKGHPPQEAIVMASYAEQFGGNNRHSYTVMFIASGSEVSWYEDSQLTLVRRGGEAEIQRVIAEREARHSQITDLAWVVANWPRIRNHPASVTAEMLMARVGIAQPWGSQGEGLAWDANWRQTFAALDECLSSGDLKYVEAVLATTRLTPIDVRIRE